MLMAHMLAVFKADFTMYTLEEQAEIMVREAQRAKANIFV